jgi:hypothetical protein
MIGFDDRRYQVFVSSTFEDLQEERQKVLQAVLEMKAFPTGMELFPWGSPKTGQLGSPQNRPVETVI